MAVVAIIPDSEQSTVWLACGTLRSLQSTAVLRELVDLLDSVDPVQVSYVQETLEHLTGEACEPTSEAWSDLLGLQH